MKLPPELSLGAVTRQGWPWTCDEAFSHAGKRPTFSVTVALLVDENEEGLEAALRSILWQATTGTEILLMGKTSTIAGVLPSSVKRLSEGGSYGEQLNRALQRATGTYFTWMRAGDLWMPSMIDSMATLAKEMSQALILSGRSLLVPCVGPSEHPVAPSPVATDGTPVVVDEFVGWPPAALLRTEMLRARDGFDASFEWLISCEWYWRSLSIHDRWASTPVIVAKTTLPRRESAELHRHFIEERRRLARKMHFYFPPAFQTFIQEDARAA